MEKFKAWMSAHPYATGIIVFLIGLFLLWFFFFRGGNNTADLGAQANAQAQSAAAAAAMSGNQLAGMQLQAQAASNQTAASVTANSDNNATALAIAQLTAQTSMNHDTLAAQAASEAAKYAAESAEVASTMTATATAATAHETTAQTYYNDLTALNMNTLNKSLDFLASQTMGGGANVINQGYLTFTPNGIGFGAQSSTAGNIPWGGGLFPAAGLTSIPNTGTVSPIIGTLPALTGQPVIGTIH